MYISTHWCNLLCGCNCHIQYILTMCREVLGSWYVHRLTIAISMPPDYQWPNEGVGQQWCQLYSQLMNVMWYYVSHRCRGNWWTFHAQLETGDPRKKMSKPRRKTGQPRNEYRPAKKEHRPAKKKNKPAKKVHSQFKERYGSIHEIVSGNSSICFNLLKHVWI